MPSDLYDKKFQERYKSLNKAQKEAVDAIDGPVMVIAGPGTGKTTILTLRIANILRKTDTPASGILAITYTEAGAKNMRVRLRELIGGRADEVRIHTFHGFAASVIAEFREHFPHLSRAEQITDVEAEAIVRKILADAAFADIRPLGNPDMYIGAILHAVREAKKEAWTAQALRDFARDEAKRVESDSESISSRGATKGQLKADAKKRIERVAKTALLADVFERYEAAKKGKFIDFDDLILELMVAIQRDELLLRLLQEKFLYVMVDEHQDTNDAQNLLVRMIVDFFETPNLFVVGDEKQAIYRFQGASVHNFLRFQQIWKDMKVISLDENYRSHQGILDAGFALIENNYGEGEHANLRVELKSGLKGAKRQPIDVVTAGNIAAEESWLASSIQKALKADPEATVAVIVRKNRLVTRALAALESRGVKAAAERGADIFSHPAGALFFEMIHFLSDPSYIEGLGTTLAAGLWGVEFGEAAEIAATLKTGKVAGIERRIPALAKLQAQKAKSSGLEFVIQAAEASSFVEAIADDPLSVEVWRGIVTLAEDISRRSKTEDPAKLIRELLSYAASAETKTVRVSLGAPDAQVTVMTAHGSKGLEFDYVFMPYSTQDSWMTQRRGPSFILPLEGGEEDRVRDTRRLFYVALTRARKHASISLSLEGPDGKETIPVGFIAEIPEGMASRSDLPSLKGSAAVVSTKPLSAREQTLADFARRSLSERGLSVTALNHFVACPARYFYKSVMRLPEAPSATAERGNAMHAALDAVWRLSSKTARSIESTIASMVEYYFSERSLLPAFERESIKAELVHDAPAVAKALLEHFSSHPKVESETWVEAIHPNKLGDIRIHGKLDALALGEDKISIFDYKTRKAMSENEMRGLTKDSSGDYFRQLVFYKKLIATDGRAKGKAIEPSLVFVAPDEKGRCPIVSPAISKKDEQDLAAHIDRLIESVSSGDVVRALCDDPDCKECALRRFALLNG